jgi:uncharacterized protein YjeT (DUF2065 family)
MLVLLVKLIGLAVAGFGLTVFTSPNFIRKIFDFVKEGKRIYWAGVARSLVGLVLLMTAPKSVLPVASVALGMIFLLSGIIVFACDLEKMKGFLTHYNELPALVARLLGLVAASFGILVFSIV